MTLEEAKEEVAKKHGFPNWNDYFITKPIYDEAAELYASSKLSEAEALALENELKYAEANGGLIKAQEKIAELEAKLKAYEPKPIECRNCGETSMSNEFVSMGISCPKCYHEN